MLTLMLTLLDCMVMRILLTLLVLRVQMIGSTEEEKDEWTAVITEQLSKTESPISK